MTSLSSIPSDELLPKYSRLVTPDILALDNEKVIATIKIRGIIYETASDNSLNNYFLSEKRLLNALCRKYGSDLAVWTHIVRRKDTFNETYKFESEFMQSFSDKYTKRFNKTDFYCTDYYITFVLKHKKLDDGISELEDILRAARVIFSPFNMQVLSIQEKKGTFLCDNLSFLSFILNNSFTDIPLSHDKAVYTIPKSNIHFGYDTVEIRNHDSDTSKFAVCYELDVYAQSTTAGMWDFILNMPVEFVLCQSMIFMQTSKTVKLMNSMINQLESADESVDDIGELAFGRDAIKSGEISFGDYHASIIVFGEDEDTAIEKGSIITNEFLSRDTTWRRSNLTSIYTLQSQLPASDVRPLSSPRTIANLTCGLSLHNNSLGKKIGNPIGDGTALIPLKTKDDTLYYFNSHASDHYKNVQGEKYSGHTLILGTTGTGKTTLEGTLVGFATRFDPAIFAIDYNRSTELYIRAFGGKYFAFNEGICTGLNPFQLDDTPKLRSFLYRLVSRCAADGTNTVSDEDNYTIKQAVDTVMSLDFINRRFSVMLQSIPMGTSLRLRLSKWCHSENGTLAWALDANENKFNPSEFNRIGFDTTFLLEPDGDKIHPACEPILATLFFIKELMQKDGQLCLTIVEEFWCPANFPLTQSLMKKILKAGRLRGEFMYLVSQSPEDAINCAIFAAIVQQTPTKILLPNPDGDPESYKKIGLSDKEIQEVLALNTASRTFLVKQSNDSVFAKLDLHGFEHLPIISGSSEDIALYECVCEQIQNDEPDNWIPVFLQVKQLQKTKDFTKNHGSDPIRWVKTVMENPL
ncbi:conjugal transfer protein TraE [Vibrio ichthyoenteri ATCC 700023]|uniref:Conjugal transfer protein TraE n=1 Tax=Vibrio ichthyoenteri ATCC 700023 TaxID=870968 RepID=F9S7H9_9VIBR|nr:conjugal transfer protein TraE [Vibrio ichthyoenteri]EGU31275.1 conjugal transfer protein TraE [Vibrio ichthyoenteri ATCC 700023]